MTIEEIKEFVAPFPETELRAIGFAGTFGRTEMQRDWLAVSDKFLFEHIVPDSWKYIIAGVARK